ncbi:MAG TPA: four helix bundle protein [Cytophagales bacterium]|nr:four helix bundle protein [Cytophagales bacterium]
MNTNPNFKFKELNVWQKAIEYAVAVVKTTEKLSTNRQHYKLIEQLESCCSSIAQNIAEGKGRYSKKEFQRFLFIARGSLYESITLLELFYRMDWITIDELNEHEKQAYEIANMLKGLINSLK